MLKIMVVDDESIVIESIKYIIEKNFKDIKVECIAIWKRSNREG